MAYRTYPLPPRFARLTLERTIRYVPSVGSCQLTRVKGRNMFV